MDDKFTNNTGKRKALIIAISEYDNLPKEKQLPFCRNDGEKIYEDYKSRDMKYLMIGN